MKIKFDDLTDQQCADIIAHFIKRKNVNEIIIHTKEDDIVIKKKRKPEICDDFLPTAGVEYII